MKKAEISVIIPIYNSEKYLSRCIESVLCQSFKDFELILVNDGSVDSSLEICKEYENKDSRILVIDSENNGSSHARNLGLDAVTGNWIIHIDSDDWIEPSMLKLLYTEAIQANADIAACGIYQDYGYKREEKNYPYSKVEPRDMLYRIDSIYSAVWNKLVKKSLYDKYNIRFIDGVTMWDDAAVTTRLRYHSSKTVIIHQPLYHYFCAPHDNMCARLGTKEPTSQIKVVRFMENYFAGINPNGKIERKIIDSLKITSKKFYLSYDDKESYNRWKSLFKESNGKIMRMKHIPISIRLVLTLASKLSYENFMRIKKIRNFLK